MKFNLTPYVSLGTLHFGMTPEQVRALIPLPYRSFKKTPNSEFPMDSFREEGIFVYYKSPGVCKAVEIALPSNVEIDGVALVGKPFDEVRNWLEQRDTNCIFDETGLISYVFGLSIYVGSLRSKASSPVESVLAFARGYYD